jgi:peptide/nickel transport system substrate-binding protein
MKEEEMQQGQDRPTLTRRRLLALSGLAVTGVVLTACGGNASPSPTTAAASTTSAGSTTAAQSAAATTSASASAATTAKTASTTTSAGGGAATPAAGGGTPAASGTPGGSGSSIRIEGNLPLPASFQDPTMLADQVKSGKLPAAKDRLPKNPLVVKPVEKVGKYGGTWRAAILNPADSVWLSRTTAYTNMLRWDADWNKVIPDTAESCAVSADGKSFTFKLREGLKWSDGQPATTDDVMFWWEDTQLNTELNPGGVSNSMKQGKDAATIEKLDQTTFKVTFKQPNGLFLILTAGGSTTIGITPKHYLQQFHKKYTDQAKLDQLIKENNVDSWVKLFQTKGGGIPGTPYDARWYNPDLPSINPWKITKGFTEGNQLIFERNPFFFKVDTDGNQLPYLDKVTFDVVQDPQVQVLKAANGELDMQDRTIATLANKAVLSDNQQKGQYHFWENIPSSMNNLIICLNLTHKNPTMRQIMQNKDFRIGLSYAIKRQEMIDTIYVSQGEPWQAAPRKETPWYNERLAKQYTEYDVAKANASLDKAFPKKDSNGIRLGPDDKPISFVVEVTTDQTDRVDGLKLIQGYWKAVGVEIQLKSEDRSLLYARKNSNEHDAVVWGGDGGLNDGIVEMRYYFPFSFESNFAQAWTAWYNPGGNPQTKAEEPPEIVKKQMSLYDQITVTPDPDKQNDLMKQILDIAADQYYCIGITLPPNGYGVVKNNFHNVPPKMFSSGGPYLNPGPTNPFQYYKD